MSAPEELRFAMSDDPRLEGNVMMILDRIMPALEHAKDYGKMLWPDDDELTECVPWTNGAIFGAVATYITLNQDDAGLDDITKLYDCICAMINDTLARYGHFDLESYAQDFLVRVGADGGDPEA